MICSYFGIAFLLFFMKIENAVYTSCQKSTFMNGLIFDIINIQITSLLNLNEIQLELLRSVNDQGYHGFVMFSLSLSKDWLNSVQQHQGNFTKDAGQKNVHIVTIEVLIQLLKLPNFSFNIRKQGGLTDNYIFDAICDVKLLASLRNFKNTCRGVLFLIKLQVLNCNCSEKILLWRCF